LLLNNIDKEIKELLQDIQNWIIDNDYECVYQGSEIYKRISKLLEKKMNNNNQAGKGDRPRNCFSEKYRKNYDDIFRKNKTARCSHCKRNDISLLNMAVFSWKECFQKFTGVCKECMNEEKEQEFYNNI